MKCSRFSLCVAGAALVIMSGLAFGGPPSRGGSTPVQIAGQQRASAPLARHVGVHGSNLEPGVAPATDQPPVSLHDGPVVQLALLLDTSNSMDGLIDQAKATLWSIVNELGVAIDEQGRGVQLQVALYEYGNNAIPREVGFIRQRTPFTTDLDVLSEQLFGLRTWGGLEYCGQVISTAMHELSWWGTESETGVSCSLPGDEISPASFEEAMHSAVRRGIDGGKKAEPIADTRPRFSKTVEGPVIRIIVIAGNEPFTQGPVRYQEAIDGARSLGVVVNTIHCGTRSIGEATGWADGARLGGGVYANIDHNRTIVRGPTPYDAKLMELNQQLNATYVGYGARREEFAARQIAMDQANADAFIAPARVAAKANAQYDNRHWDLVDAVKTGEIDLAKIEAPHLPEELRSLTPAELSAKIEALSQDRSRVQSEILSVSRDRNRFIAEQSAEVGGEKGLDAALVEALRGQVLERGLRFVEAGE